METRLGEATAKAQQYEARAEEAERKARNLQVPTSQYIQSRNCFVPLTIKYLLTIVNS